MHIIDLKPLEPGVYNDHKSDSIVAPPEGWAMIPKDVPLPSTFPRLGSIEAEEITYTYEVEVEKEETKTREVEILGPDGKPVKVTEEYKEKVLVTEQREKVILTVTAMTEGTLPDPVEPEPSTEDDLMSMAIDHEYRLTLLELGVV